MTDAKNDARADLARSGQVHDHALEIAVDAAVRIDGLMHAGEFAEAAGVWERNRHWIFLALGMARSSVR